MLKVEVFIFRVSFPKLNPFEAREIQAKGPSDHPVTTALEASCQHILEAEHLSWQSEVALVARKLLCKASNFVAIFMCTKAPNKMAPWKDLWAPAYLVPSRIPHKPCIAVCQTKQLSPFTLKIHNLTIWTIHWGKAHLANNSLADSAWETDTTLQPLVISAPEQKSSSTNSSGWIRFSQELIFTVYG